MSWLGGAPAEDSGCDAANSAETHVKADSNIEARTGAEVQAEIETETETGAEINARIAVSRSSSIDDGSQRGGVLHHRRERKVEEGGIEESTRCALRGEINEDDARVHAGDLSTSESRTAAAAAEQGAAPAVVAAAPTVGALMVALALSCGMVAAANRIAPPSLGTLPAATALAVTFATLAPASWTATLAWTPHTPKTLNSELQPQNLNWNLEI